ncbi:MAG: B12-binding domain-containing radical SAM protein [Bacteroidales bacterium]|nr:B12-binding domain-containing radical SAM protein [Bacteroidales bacterium]
MNITLIISAEKNDPLRKKDPFMPLSLAIIAGTAPEHTYEFIDLLWDDPDIDYDKPVDVVGISVRMSAEKRAFELGDEFRKRNVKVILGGPQASVNPFETKQYADAVVIGEGEQLWPVILKDIKNKELKDFYVCSPRPFQADGYSVYQPDGLPELEKTAKPLRNLFKRKYTFDLVYASRGCPINCDFCSVTKLFGSRYRFRPIQDVIDEIAQFKKYYYLIDDTVFGRPNTFDYYIELYEEIARLPKINFWTGQANLDAASHEKGREVIKKAVKSGLIYTAIGMESIDLDVLKKSGSFNKMGIKNDDDVIEKMKDNIRFIQRQGILISGWFTIGYEDDTIETYYKTWEFCKEMNIIPVFSPVYALKGTDIYNRLSASGQLVDHSVNITNIKNPNMTNQQVIEALTHVVKKGYSFNRILNRTWFYFNMLRKQKQNSLNDIIHKTIFALVTQIKIGSILRSENRIRLNKIRNHGN